MTDYLELLLEQAQEEAEEPFVWRRVAVGAGGVRAKDEPGQESGGNAAAEKEERVMAVWKRRTEAVSGGQRPADPVEQLAALERAVARGRAEQQSRTGRRLPLADDTHAAQGRMVCGADDVMPGARRSLAGLLDAAFERDARRYDGPLGLF